MRTSILAISQNTTKEGKSIVNQDLNGNDSYPMPVNSSSLQIFSLSLELLSKRVDILVQFFFSSSILSIIVSGKNIYNSFRV